VLLDRAYRGLARRPQVYAPQTAMAPFRDIDALRRGLAPERDQRAEPVR
jgi:hypothetical protein